MLGCPITDSFLSELSINCQQLERVDLSQTQVSVVCLYHLISNLPKITHIDFTDGQEAANMDMLNVIGEGVSRPLVYLNIRNSPVSDALLSYIVSRCPHLEELICESCSLLTDFSVMKLANFCPRLKVLDLSFCDLVSDVSLQVC
jgi:hypothetical protein